MYAAEVCHLTTSEVDGNDSLQIEGTATGTKMAPSFANLLLGLFKSKASGIAPLTPHWYSWFRSVSYTHLTLPTKLEV